MSWNNVTWPSWFPNPNRACHGAKPVFLATGKMAPYPWTPEVLPVQILKVGELAIVAVPFECTTMCGRRLKNAVKSKMTGISSVVIAGLSNAYAGYVTTKEEYDTQNYEGASTHFGPYTLNAFTQEFTKLAEALRDGRGVSAGPTPRNLINKQSTLQTGVVFDDTPTVWRWERRRVKVTWKNWWRIFEKWVYKTFKVPHKIGFGEVKDNAGSAYRRGNTVTVRFWGAHPKNNLRTMSTFLEVQKKNGNNWSTVKRDLDPETAYKWERNGLANSVITVTWKIPGNTSSGTYRIRHHGNWKNGWNGRISGYSGTSREFSVR